MGLFVTVAKIFIGLGAAMMGGKQVGDAVKDYKKNKQGKSQAKKQAEEAANYVNFVEKEKY
jgi:membrane protease subunit (stomatin/prohibitin family)